MLIVVMSKHIDLYCCYFCKQPLLYFSENLKIFRYLSFALFTKRKLRVFRKGKKGVVIPVLNNMFTTMLFIECYHLNRNSMVNPILPHHYLWWRSCFSESNCGLTKEIPAKYQQINNLLFKNFQ